MCDKIVLGPCTIRTVLQTPCVNDGLSSCQQLDLARAETTGGKDHCMLCGRDPADGADGMVEKLVSTEQRMIELSL